MAVTEKALQAQIERAILSAHPSSWVFHPVGGPFQMVGVPDLIVCVDGLFVALEIKHQKPGESQQHAVERTTLVQRNQIMKIQRAGGYAKTVLSVEEALSAVAEAIQNHREKVCSES